MLLGSCTAMSPWQFRWEETVWFYWGHSTCQREHQTSTTWINIRHMANSHYKQRGGNGRKKEQECYPLSFLFNVTKVSWHISQNESQSLPSSSLPFHVYACLKLLNWLPSQSVSALGLLLPWLDIGKSQKDKMLLLCQDRACVRVSPKHNRRANHHNIWYKTRETFYLVAKNRFVCIFHWNPCESQSSS